jgi:photosystem II stability/assembly factor-like uncharacterized protein
VAFEGELGGHDVIESHLWLDIDHQNKQIMKNAFRVLAFTFSISLGGLSSAFAQWVPSNGPYGGYITAFTASGNSLFAGTYTGSIFLSTNNGSNWEQVYSSNAIFSDFAVNGTNIFASTSDGILRATNNGTSGSSLEWRMN